MVDKSRRRPEIGGAKVLKGGWYAGWRGNKEEVYSREEVLCHADEDIDSLVNKGYWEILPRSSSGNLAFDEYKEATLRRLDQEQKEFLEFRRRLELAKDKAEFDQFMAERQKPYV